MARFMAIAGAPNYAPQLTVAALGPTASGMPASNLQTEEPSEVCRITTLDVSKTGWSFIRSGSDALIPGGPPWIGAPSFDALAAINHNFTEGVATYRWICDVNGLPPYSNIAPTSNQLQTNITGNVTDIDEDTYAPDGVFQPATALGAATTLRVRFPTPGHNLTAGANIQTFRVLGKLKTGETAPRTVTLSLYQAGVLKATLSSASITVVNTNVIFHGFWNASSLTSLAGVSVECQVDCTGAFSVDAIDWVQDAPLFSWPADTGWLTVPSFNDISLWNSSSPTSARPTKNLYYLPVPSVQQNAVQLLVRDLLNPDGFVQFGVGIVGPAFFPSKVNFAKGPLVSVRDPSPRAFTLGGQEYGSRQRARRVMPVSFPQLLEAEGWSLFDRLDWLKGTKGAFLAVRYPDDQTAQRHTALWCTLENPQGLSLPSAFARHSWSGMCVEKL